MPTLYTQYRQSHFAPAFFFLPPERRRALKILYAVCRVLDDAVDIHSENPEACLAAWKDVFLKRDLSLLKSFGQEVLASDFLAVVDQFQIPLFAMVDLIEKGVAIDLKKNRFQTPLDLENYCYGVAGTVGIACLPIFGVPWMEGKDFATRLGIAIQWVNIIRDVGVDAQMGRIYLPLDHLEQFGYTQSDIFSAKNLPELTALLKYEVSVARAHFRRATELLPERWRKELLPARIMGRIYSALLEKLEKNGFPVYDQKVRLNVFEKALVTWKTVRE